MSAPAPPLTEVFSALGDPMRWQILTHLSRGPASASALATQLPVTRQAISQHLDVLHKAGLVESRRAGRELRFEVCRSAVSDAAARLGAIATGWERNLDALRRAAEHQGALDREGSGR